MSRVGIEKDTLDIWPTHDWSRPVWKDAPILPLLDTIELMESIPAGEWRSPNTIERISPRPNSQEHTDRLIKPFVSFLNSAKRGEELVVQTMEESILSGDSYSITMYVHYISYVLAPMGIDTETNEGRKLLESAKRGFVTLLSAEAREELDETEEFAVSAEDVNDAKLIVEVISQQIIRLGFKERFRPEPYKAGK